MKFTPMILVACLLLIGGVAVQAIHVLIVNPEAHADGWQMVAVMGLLMLGIVIGLMRGNRFAWQSGRMLAFVAALLLIVYGTLDMTHRLPGGVNPSGTGIWMVASGICFAAAAGALHTRAAKGHVDLICPKCQTPTSRPANLSFREARCRNPKCNHKW